MWFLCTIILEQTTTKTQLKIHCMNNNFCFADKFIEKRLILKKKYYLVSKQILLSLEYAIKI